MRRNSMSEKSRSENSSPNEAKMKILSHEEKKSHKCPICGCVFTRKDVLKIHIDSVHEGKQPPLQCKVCDYATFRKSNLKQHITSLHEGKKPHQCTICDYKASQSGQLKKHIYSVHDGKKPFLCHIQRFLFYTCKECN